MNHSLPVKSYLNDEVNNKVEDDNPHSIVLNILIELKKNISTLAYCLEHDGTVSEVKSKSFSKSLTAIYILQSSLDMKLGGEIAENLYNLYEYCRTTIIKAFRNKDFLSVQSLVPILNEILDGWKGIKN